MGILIAFFEFFEALFAMFSTFLLAIPVLIVVIILIVLQRKRNNEKEDSIEAQQKSHRFCRNCGKPISAGSTVCTGCGVRVGVGKRFCPRCGNRTDVMAVVCVSCGAPLNVPDSNSVSKKSKLAAGLLGIFLGSLGIHNFYLGYTLKAVAQVVITVFCAFSGLSPVVFIVAIWGLIEGVLILAGGISKDASGKRLS